MGIEVRWVAEAMHVSWAAGVSHFFWFGLRDEPLGPPNPASETVQGGLFFTGKTMSPKPRPKPIIKAFRFPFVAYPGKKGVRFWGRTPNGRRGKVRLQVKRKGKVALVRQGQSEPLRDLQGDRPPPLRPQPRGCRARRLQAPALARVLDAPGPRLLAQAVRLSARALRPRPNR